MICIVDYGAGNLRSVQKAVERLGASAHVSSKPVDVARASKVIFPGVGAFGRAVEAVDNLRLRETLIQFIEDRKPFLGICLGLQLLFESSEENPGVAGLGILSGSVKRFPDGLKIPHLGWNQVNFSMTSPLWHNIPDNGYFYFAHSYYVAPDDAAIVSGECDYGIVFPVAIKYGLLFGLQFHPEKSQHWGLGVLKNFIEL
jgi:glutamine amidotransferase